ncbi:putative bifunctional diguanylate cyclase/phosphodiesterase [Gayadomonas joobiniege]|uniref:putative bifunctional diguanylate cyclase/phosphodiesterase n=1 Tax=Gayadomonas joobiniege TaxID=1234606 RepID=UPI0003764A54|nr:GGDEF domain-containing phosphodiesterase [Gayadomonas joobiniege]
MTQTRDLIAGEQAVLAVPRRRRYRLCQILTIIGVVFLCSFGSLSLANGASFLGTILLTSALIGLINLYLLKRSRNVDRAAKTLTCILFVLSMSLLVTGGKDNTGILWIYPIVAINLFINRFWPAVILFIIFSVISTLLLFTPLSNLLLTTYTFTEAVRFILTILALNVICLAALYAEEKASETVLQLYNEDVRQRAYFDSLTGLPNRWSFIMNLGRMISRAEVDKQRIGLLYIDLDNFKQINDQYGHETGDRVLLKFSERLTDSIRPSDQLFKVPKESLARLAGDEFVVLLPNIQDPLDASSVATRILKMFEGGFGVDNIEHMVYASIGIAVYPDDAKSPADLLRQADAAMYSAKQEGRNCFRFFTQEIAERLSQRQHIETGLRLALREKEFVLVYMPIFDCKNNKIVAIEVLLRCPSHDLVGIGPDQFIPVAEATGMIKDIDLWVIENAFSALIVLQNEQQFTGKFCINISGLELKNEQFPTHVKNLLERYKISPQCIEFEVTETAFVAGDLTCLKVLNALDKLGVSIALDDFGTGYTAFNQLIHYPADCLKIDRSFVNDLFSEREARNKMVMIIQSLANLYQLRVIAEGVETEAQLNYLKEHGCDWVQGYFLSPPLNWDDLIKRLNEEPL